MSEDLLRYECMVASGRVDPRALVCLLCQGIGKEDISFENENELREHVLLDHSSELLGWDECKKCGISMKKSSFKAHCQKVHLRMGTIVCPSCGKHFFSKHTYERHRNLHTGERNYHCTLAEGSCSASFNSFESLVYHARKHHNVNLRLRHGQSFEGQVDDHYKKPQTKLGQQRIHEEKLETHQNSRQNDIRHRDVMDQSNHQNKPPQYPDHNKPPQALHQIQLERLMHQHNLYQPRQGVELQSIHQHQIHTCNPSNYPMHQTQHEVMTSHTSNTSLLPRRQINGADVSVNLDTSQQEMTGTYNQNAYQRLTLQPCLQQQEQHCLNMQDVIQLQYQHKQHESHPQEDQQLIQNNHVSTEESPVAIPCMHMLQHGHIGLNQQLPITTPSTALNFRDQEVTHSSICSAAPKTANKTVDHLDTSNPLNSVPSRTSDSKYHPISTQMCIMRENNRESSQIPIFVIEHMSKHHDSTAGYCVQQTPKTESCRTSATTEIMASPTYPCFYCPETFKTPWKRSRHHARSHPVEHGSKSCVRRGGRYFKPRSHYHSKPDLDHPANMHRSSSRSHSTIRQATNIETIMLESHPNYHSSDWKQEQTSSIEDNMTLQLSYCSGL